MLSPVYQCSPFTNVSAHGSIPNGANSIRIAKNILAIQLHNSHIRVQLRQNSSRRLEKYWLPRRYEYGMGRESSRESSPTNSQLICRGSPACIQQILHIIDFLHLVSLFAPASEFLPKRRIAYLRRRA